MTVVAYQGAVHNYLGMIFDFSVKRKVMINMINYIKNIITNFPVEIMAIRTSPAVDHLFTVRDDPWQSTCQKNKQGHFIISLPSSSF